MTEALRKVSDTSGLTADQFKRMMKLYKGTAPVDKTKLPNPF